jgi:hypothetical protein
MRLIDADKLKQHYAWWGEDDAQKRLFDEIVDRQPTVAPPKKKPEKKLYVLPEIILEPKPGSVVLYLADNGQIVPVRIISGQWMGTYGLSNFWKWINLYNDQEESGYGAFYKITLPKKEYEEDV